MKLEYSLVFEIGATKGRTELMIQCNAVMA